MTPHYSYVTVETSEEFAGLVRRLFKREGRVEPTLHASIGIAGEAGELLDAFKKFHVYNSPLDVNNVIEELGDIEFYLEAMRQALGVSRNTCIYSCMTKLNKRYPSGSYTDEHAQSRLDKS